MMKIIEITGKLLFYLLPQIFELKFSIKTETFENFIFRNIRKSPNKIEIFENSS